MYISNFRFFNGWEIVNSRTHTEVQFIHEKILYHFISLLCISATPQKGKRIQSFNLTRRLYRRFIAESICLRHGICYRRYVSFYDSSILTLCNRYNHIDQTHLDTILCDEKVTAKLCKTNSWHSAVRATVLCKSMSLDS